MHEHRKYRGWIFRCMVVFFFSSFMCWCDPGDALNHYDGSGLCPCPCIRRLWCVGTEITVCIVAELVQLEQALWRSLMCMCDHSEDSSASNASENYGFMRKQRKKKERHEAIL